MNEEQRQEEIKRIKKRQERDKLEELEVELLGQLGGNFGLLLMDVFRSKGASYLSLSGYKYSQQEFGLLFKALEFNQNVKILSIIRDQLDPNTTHSLFAILRVNKTLNKLVLQENGLDNRIIGQLAKSLESNFTLKVVSFEGNRVFSRNETKKLRKLTNVLLKSKTIQSLNFTSCGMMDEHLKMLIDLAK